MRTLNLGILAHVDAGKTSLTERLLHHAGVTTEVGRVDAGTAHTDFLDLERQRGITIKAAVVSFVVDDVKINLIDTPGHPDFIAEVERTLGVLDGAVLVISAVEGVQAQTRILMRALQRLRIPTLLFINKIDRVGAREQELLRQISERLTPSVIALGTTKDLGTRAADVVPLRPAELDLTALAEHDDGLLESVIEGTPPPLHVIPAIVAEQAKAAKIHPVLFGAALTGAGIDVMTEAIVELLPGGDATIVEDQSLSATVFKIERAAAGEGVAYVRMFAGVLHVRQRVMEEVVTAIEVFEAGATERRPFAVAGEIAKVWGLATVRIGDTFGDPAPGRRGAAAEPFFAPPTLETVAVPDNSADRVPLHAALAQLAEQDPLIDFRQDELGGDLRLSLYGEVQKEVIQATLASEFGLHVSFRESRPICIERLRGSGAAFERMPRGRSASRPFLAGVGLHLAPASPGAGVMYVNESQLGRLPASFLKAVDDAVHEALAQGVHGWRVTDCVVTLTHSQYAPRQSHAHQGFSKAMSSVGSDFRLLTPLVLAAALRQAGTIVCEPVHRYQMEIPAEVLPVMVPLLARLEAAPLEQASRGSSTLMLSGLVLASAVHTIQHQLPELTRGEGVLETEFDSFRPVRGATPARRRTGPDPFRRKDYLLTVLGAT